LSVDDPASDSAQHYSTVGDDPIRSDLLADRNRQETGRTLTPQQPVTATTRGAQPLRFQ